MRLTKNCPICSKRLDLEWEQNLYDSDEMLTLSMGSMNVGKALSHLESYRCGHIFVTEIKPKSDEPRIFETKSLDEKLEAYAFQKDGVEFILNSGYKCLIADQMGLGKTIQALLALRAKYSEKRTLILVKSATTIQWIREYKLWCDPLPLGVYMINGAKNWIPPGFNTYVCSMDTFWRVKDKLLEMQFNLIIVDEVHSFKNPDSARSKGLVQFVRDINEKWESKQETTTKTTFTREIVQECGLIFLSGTPIKNRADEYFIPLNLLRPEKFSSIERFRRNWLAQSENGKWERVRDYLIEDFREEISPYILRRERNEVIPDLPKFSRHYVEVIIGDENLKKAYNLELSKLQDLEAEKILTYKDIQDNLMRMRRIIGMAKCEFTTNYIKEFLEETDSEKIAIAVHHHPVRDTLHTNLKAFDPTVISGEDSSERKQSKVDEWKDSKSNRRLAIISTLAGGVGLNLQFCNNFIVIERQWNAADEEQFEDRFNRIGQERPVTGEYFVAKGTIDEWFHQMILKKREIFGETIGNQWNLESDAEGVKEMVEWAIHNRL